MTDEGSSDAELSVKILALLKDNQDGISNDELLRSVGGNNPSQCGTVVNELLGDNKIEMFKAFGMASSGFMIRIKKGNQLQNVTNEEQLVYSLVEESGQLGVWIRDIRERSGLNDTQLKRILKSLEGRKLVKSIKAVGTTRKSYILYGIEADESLTGGTFYSDQQLDSEFVETLIQVCVTMLLSRRKQAEDEYKNDILGQRDAMYVESDEVAKYIHDKGICKIQLGVSDIEAILDIAVLDGRLEKRLNHTYRAVKIKRHTTALSTVPCLYCPVSGECSIGHVISPENCEYFKEFYEL